jgi:hypothetical protein
MDDEMREKRKERLVKKKEKTIGEIKKMAPESLE